VTVVFNIILPVLAGVSLIAALFFVTRAFSERSRSSREAYGVGQVEASRAMRIDWVRALAAGLVGLILLAVFLMTLPPPPLEPAADTLASPTAVSPTDAATTTATLPPPVQVTNTPEPSATSPAPTVTPTLPPIPAATPEPRTAVVSSGVGVWLRATPSASGEQVEYLLDGVILTLLPGVETADGFQWQQARTLDGNEGWVAIGFLEIEENE